MSQAPASTAAGARYVAPSVGARSFAGLFDLSLGVGGAWGLAAATGRPTPALAWLATQTTGAPAGSFVFERVAAMLATNPEATATWVLEWWLAIAAVLAVLGVLPRTPGQWLSRIMPVDAAGRPARIVRRGVRATLLTAAPITLWLSAAWCVVSRRRRAWHDALAGVWWVKSDWRGRPRLA
ncbi:MAG: RDD family protein [Myxococcales bacterium]|nr:RDD family protein [Myxococcales bacterium]